MRVMHLAYIFLLDLIILNIFRKGCKLFVVQQKLFRPSTNLHFQWGL